MSWSIQRCQSISVSSPAKRSPNSGRTLYSQRRRMLAIVVSEYGLPVPRRRPIRPRSTPSSHSSPSAPNVGPRAASSARWSAPLAAAASQTSTSPRSLVVLLQTGLPVTGSRRRPRHDGLQRHRASGSAIGRADSRVRDVDARESGASASSPSTPLAASRGKSAPGGHAGDTDCQKPRGSLGFVGVGGPNGIPRETPATARKTANEADAGGGTRTPDTRIMIPLL